MTEMKLLMQSVQQHQVRYSISDFKFRPVYMCMYIPCILLIVIMCICKVCLRICYVTLYAAMLHLHSSHIARDFHQQFLICITHVSINMLTLPFQHYMHRKQFQICSIYTRMSCQSYPSAPSTNCCLLQGCMTNNFTCILQQVLYYNMDCFPPYI